ncbi:MAG: D-aminoacylase [Christensenella sp.]|nr:D-aminoacylase [Christensenella sp.]
MRVDLLLKNGKIVDGTGNPWYYGDVAISDGKITAIGKLDEIEAKETIDVQGLVVSPGFIDIHTHADFILPLKNHMEILAPFAEQGITTVCTGNCGLSCAPVAAEHLKELDDYTTFFQGGSLQYNWSTLGEFLNVLEDQGVGLNMIPLASHGAIRIAVMGMASGQPTEEQMEQMKVLCARDMKDGAFGLSAGLIYAPGMFADTNELIEITKPLISYQGVFTCHIRGSSETNRQAVEEIIEVGRVNGIPIQHSHTESFGKNNWSLVDDVIALHEKAREEGIDVGWDVIPYVTANTTLGACFPSECFGGGMEAFVARLRNPVQRAKIKDQVENMVSEWPTWLPGRWCHNLLRNTGYENVMIIWLESDVNQKLIGKTLMEIAQEQGKDPFDVLADVMVEENGACLALYIGVSGDFEDDTYLKKLLAHEQSAICTDAILTGAGLPNCSAYGSFPRVLGHYVREEKLTSLEQMIRKMTSISAQRFGIEDRGLIKPGMWADITVFDADTICDNSEVQKPDQRPTGIQYVFVNGAMMVKDGICDPSFRGGQVLRKQ